MKVVKTEELETLSTNVKEQDKQTSSQLVKKEEIKNSPFTIITQDGVSFGVMGNYKVTENAKSKKEIKKQLETITWNRIIQVVMLLDEIKTNLKTSK
jgi:translation elongation factor P/translation initiation factor 5A